MRFFTMLKEAFNRFLEDNTFRLGAALAYYTVFSIAPVVLITISIASLIFGAEAARGNVTQEISHVVGPRVGKAIEDMLAYNEQEGGGIFATILSVVLLVVGASSIFGQLQDALNTIWGVQPKPGQGLWGMIRTRVLSFGMVLVIGFLLLVSLVMSAALSALTSFVVSSESEVAVYVGQALNFVASFAISTLLFALIFKVLPDVEIRWSDVWVGALLTAALFAVGKFLIGLYLGQASWINAYGAAGSLIVLLLWVYYSSQILLFGAEFTEVYAQHAGHGLAPAPYAEPVTAEARARQGMPGPTPQERVHS